MIELLLTEAKVIFKAIEDKFEKKLGEAFPENFRTVSKTLIMALGIRHHKKCLNIKKKGSDLKLS